MPELTVTEDTYLRLQRLAQPFVDTPESVISRLLSQAENQAARDADEGDAGADQAMPDAGAEQGATLEPTNLRRVNRPTLNKNWERANPMLAFPAPDGGEYRIRHSDLSKLVRDIKPQTYEVYEKLGVYNWPSMARWMRDALSGFRVR